MSRIRPFPFITTLVLLGVAAVAFSPYRIGPFRDFRIIVYLKYWGVMRPSVVSGDVLIDRLASNDPRLQTDAAFSIGVLPKDPRTVRALIGFLDRPDVASDVKDVAVWSLGELRAREALPNLRSRIGNERYDQENLLRAVRKIEGRIPRGVLPE
ncbi:MAG: HEAT repeat domain-containing protein [Bacteroidota bacterium]|nr:HEAT repeat domain-containing protein [Bacteroidota bacterium]